MRRTRVLVVDDEPLVASAARRLLARAHEVQVAHNGHSALELIETGRFDAVLCDILMPHMTGLELHALLSATRPEVAGRMVFLTGGVFDGRAERFLEDNARWCMGKPFDPGALLALVAGRIASADALAPCRRMV
ncbi:MAG TPA: response regulator [Myxococcaceae bacterium]|jgi:CheY-like chemotaxis protein